MIEASVSATQIARMARLAAGGAFITTHLGDALDQLAQEMVHSIDEHMHFQQGYETGRLRESVSAKREGLELRVGSDQPYAEFVEYGTGARGAASGVGIPQGYAYGQSAGMSAEPYLAPALEEMQPVIKLYFEEAVEAGLQEMAR